MPAVSPASRLRLVPIALGQAIGVMCGVAGVKLNSQLIAPATLGGYGVFLTFAPLGIWVVHAGLLKFVARHWAQAPDRAGLRRRIVTAWAKRLPWLAFATLGGAWAIARVAEWPVASVWLCLFSAAALLSLGSLAQTALQADAAHWRDCAASAAGSVSRTAFPPLLLLLSGGGIGSLLVGFTFHALLFAVIAAWVLGNVHPAVSTNAKSEDISGVYGGALFTVLAAAGWILSGVNRWLVAGFFGDTEAGYFTLAGGAAVVLSSTLGAVFAQYFQPGTFALADAGHPLEALARRTDRIAFAYTAAALAAIAAFSGAAPWLVGPLIDERYRAALTWILPAGCFGVATIIPVFYQALLLAARRERACGPMELSTAAVLISGGVASAVAGRDWFIGWLLLTPLLPWLLTRSLARWQLFKPGEDPACALGP